MADGENIMLARFNIDIDEVVKEATRLRQEMNRLAEQQKEMREKGQAETDLYTQQEVELKKLRSEYNRHIKLAQDLNQNTKEQAESQERLTKALNSEAQSINQAKEANKELNRLRGDINTTTQEGRQALEDINRKIAENTEYIKGNTKATRQQADAAQEAARREEMMETALQGEIRTIQEAREQNTLLNKLRNTTNLTTEEGRKELDRLNRKLDENNEFIRENVDAYTQQKINIGNYSESVQEALGTMDIFNGGLVGMVSQMQAAGGATAFLTQTMTALRAAALATLKAFSAFLISPIGAAIAAIGGAFLLVQNAMSRSEDAGNRLGQAFAGLSGIINMFKRALEPLGDMIINGIVATLEAGEKAAISFMGTLAGFLDRLGFDDAAAGLREFQQEYEQSIEQARELARAEDELTKSRRRARLVQLEYQQAAEELRQIRDDESRSIRERIEANRELGEVLQEQTAAEMEIADQRVRVARLYIQEVGETAEALDRLAEAETERQDIRERITGQRSEQLTNENALLREQETLRVEAIQAEIQANQNALEMYLLQQGRRKQSLREELETAQEVRRRRIELARQAFEATKKTANDRTALNLEIERAEIELAEKQTEIAISSAEREYQIYRENLEKRKSLHGEFTREWLEDEISRNNELLRQERELADIRLREGVINQQERDEAVRQAAETAAEANEEARRIREEAAAVQREERRAAEFEAEILRRETEGETLFALERERQARQDEIRRQELEQRLNDQLISRENYNAQVRLLEQQSAKALREINRTEMQARLDMADKTLGELTDLVGENTAAGKGFSVAQALINTYEGITAALTMKPFPVALASAAIAAATGFKAVKDILSVDVPGQDNAGGANAGAAAGGAQNINANTPRAGGPVLNATALGNVDPGGRQMNTADFAASTSSLIQDDIRAGYNRGNLTRDISEAVRDGSRAGTREGSQRGITELSENRAIETSSAF